jgi:hypothetical protein
MPGPATKAPSKKVFHFPKTAETAASEPAGSKRKSPAKPAVEAAKAPAKSKAKAAPVESAAAEDKVKRPKKEKVVRDSFTMPKSDYDKIGLLKQKCLANGVHVKKGELLRAGLLILERANIEQLTAAVAAVETVKTGRPGKS